MNKIEYNEYRNGLIRMIESLGYARVKYNNPDYLPKTYRRSRGRGFSIVPGKGVHICLADWNERFSFAPIFVNVNRDGKSACIGGNVFGFTLNFIGVIKGEISVDDFMDSAFGEIRI